MESFLNISEMSTHYIKVGANSNLNISNNCVSEISTPKSSKN